MLYADVLDIKAICATGRLGKHPRDTKPEIIREQVEAYNMYQTGDQNSYSGAVQWPDRSTDL